MNEEKVNTNVSHKIPENFLKDISKHAIEKNKLSRDFLQISINIENAQEVRRDTLTKLKESEKNIQKQIEYAFNKMKLGKDKNYRWQFDGKDTFIGIRIENKQ